MIGPGTYLESTGLVVIEAENGERTNGQTHTWLLKTTLPGYTGTSYPQPSLDIDALYQTNEITVSPYVDFPLYVTTPGIYTVWLRGYAPTAAGDSVYVGVGTEQSNELCQYPYIVFQPRELSIYCSGTATGAGVSRGVRRGNFVLVKGVGA